MKILIAEDDNLSGRVLAVTLAKWGHEVVLTTNGNDAWDKLHRQGAPMLAILDWMMPGIDGLEICRRVRREMADSFVYIILLTALTGRDNLLEGLEAGADDYITKPFDRNELRMRLRAGARIVELQNNLQARVRDLEQAVRDREQAHEALRNISMTDSMTGLYNYRGFYTLAEHNAKVSRRSGQPSALIFADMDGLKQINDKRGHAQGSLALTEVAEILRKSSRDCDVVARLGGDEFVILAPNVVPDEMNRLVQRVRDDPNAFNKESPLGFPLSLSIGAVSVDHRDDRTIEEYVTMADHSMYEEKRQKARYSLEPPIVELSSMEPAVGPIPFQN